MLRTGSCECVFIMKPLVWAELHRAVLKLEFCVERERYADLGKYKAQAVKYQLDGCTPYTRRWMDGWMEQEDGRMGGWYREYSMALAWAGCISNAAGR